MKFYFFIFSIGCLILFSVTGRTQTAGEIEIPLGLEKSPDSSDSFIPYVKVKRPKIGIALSGGGARGLAQIGVLKVFERHGLPIDGIVGTSMGAIIGGLFAVGYSAMEIDSLAHQIQWGEIIQDKPPRKQLFLGQKEERAGYILQVRLRGFSFEIPSGYTAGQKLTMLLSNLIMNAPYSFSSNFDKLHIPFRAVATDLLTGEEILLKKGSLVDALRASMAIPILFTPVHMGNKLLVDGGLVQNLPVAETKSLGADIVIGVDTSSKLRDAKSLRAPWQIADQVTTIMQQEKIRSQLKTADVSIQPFLDNISNTDFHKIDSIIRAGEEAAEKTIPEIENLLRKKSKTWADTLFFIKKIFISGCRKLDPQAFLNEIKIDTSSLVPTAQIIWAGRSLIQTGYFSNVSAFVDTSIHALIFRVKENPFIKKTIISGNKIFPDSLLLACMETTGGEVLNIQKGRRDIHRLAEKYHREGYALANVRNIHIEDGILKIVIDEGRIGEIKLVGNNHTRPFVILRELPLRSGDLFNVSLLRQGIENIYSTGYFEEVRFGIHQEGQSHDLIFNLIEHGYTLARVGLRYDLERRAQGYLQAVEENFLGFGSKCSLTALTGKRDEMFRIRFWSDRFLYTYITYRINFSLEKHYFNYYQNHKQVGTYGKSIRTLSLSLGQQMRRFGTLSLRIRSEKINLEPTGRYAPRERFTLRNITLKSEVDTRDHVPFPTMGKYHLLEYETAGKFIGSDVSYSKIFSSMESYYSLFPFLVFHPKISWGTSDMTTPFAKQFRLGGLNSFIGLPEDVLVGKRFILLSGEIRYRVPSSRWIEAYLSLRYDFGGMWGRYTKIMAKDFKQGIGAIFSLNTLLGPIHIGYGHMSDGENQWYFSAGYRF